MSNRGHTGTEGHSTKAWALLAGAAGMIWLIIAFLFQGVGSALTLPILLVAASGVAYVIGVTMAK